MQAQIISTDVEFQTQSIADVGRAEDESQVRIEPGIRLFPPGLILSEENIPQGQPGLHALMVSIRWFW